MKLLARITLLSLITLICIGCDQSTKIAAKDNLYGHASISYLDGIFNLVYAENSGIMLGLGSTLPENLRFILFVLFIGILLAAAIVFVLLKPLHQRTVIAISLIVGGGISNLIDRLIRDGSVIDFMVIKMGPLESGIFNVADIAIILGTCILSLSFVSSNRTT
jgi:signal peptidase II